VFCPPEAGDAIKAFSPELIVHPFLINVLDVPSSLITTMSKMSHWIPKLTCLVVGPGLGRDPSVEGIVYEIIKECRKNNLPLVIDADGIWAIRDSQNLVAEYPFCCLTPNFREFLTLESNVEEGHPDEISHPSQVALEVVNLAGESTDEPGDLDLMRRVARVAQVLRGTTIMLKGQYDVITDGSFGLFSGGVGSNRRAAGQGDILSGVLAVFLAWARSNKGSSNDVAMKPLVAAFSSSTLVRRCANEAFSKHRRSMTAPDMINEIGSQFSVLFEDVTTPVARVDS